MNQNIHDLADAYAVGALTEAEYAEYTAHLEHCPSCRREVADLLDVTSAMSESVAVDPPPGLRASVLAAIAQTPQEPAASEPEPQARAVARRARRRRAASTKACAPPRRKPPRTSYRCVARGPRP